MIRVRVHMARWFWEQLGRRTIAIAIKTTDGDDVLILYFMPQYIHK